MPLDAASWTMRRHVLRILALVILVMLVTLVLLEGAPPGLTGHAGALSRPSERARGAEDSHVANPTVEPVRANGPPLGGLRYDVSSFGYQEKEYFFSGIAKTYPPAPPAPASFRSRMIVWTPKDKSEFNGTTVVEWAEVSDAATYELTVELNYESQMLMRRGFAFVLVSAQQGGVCGRNPATGQCSPMSLKGADSAALWHAQYSQ